MTPAPRYRQSGVRDDLARLRCPVSATSGLWSPMPARRHARRPALWLGLVTAAAAIAGLTAAFAVQGQIGSTAVSVIMLCRYRPGNGGHRPPRVSPAMAMRASGLWNP